MRSSRRLSLAALLGVMLWSTAEVAANDSYHSVRAGLGFHYSSGTYGGTSTTNIVYMPLTARAETGRWSFWGTVPYLRISGPGGIIQGPNGPIQTASGVNEGLGDMLTRGSYLLPSGTQWIPFLEFIGVVKFPTASRAKGLGTGEFDYGAECEATWALGAFSPFALAGYRILGSSPSIPLHNVAEASAGAQYRIHDGINLGLLFDYRQAASAASGTRADAVPYASFRLRDHWAIDLYASAGLAVGSPDAGFGFQISYILSNLE